MTKENGEDELTARAVNAQPWEPLPGMTKKRCSLCRYISMRFRISVFPKIGTPMKIRARSVPSSS